MGYFRCGGYLRNARERTLIAIVGSKREDHRYIVGGRSYLTIVCCRVQGCPGKSHLVAIVVSCPCVACRDISYYKLIYR